MEINYNQNIKKTIIPDEWKSNIDNILNEQLFNANRYYAENMPSLNEKVMQFAQLDSADFLKLLKKQWKWHNEFYENLLEPAISKYISMEPQEFSLQDIQELMEIYKTMCKVDQATLVVSAGIKKNLEKNVANAGKGIRSDDEKFMLLTPPAETFFAKYYIEHIKYIIELKKQNHIKANNIKQYLLKEYHADDEKIFEGRIKRFSKLMDMSIEQLENEIKTSTISNDYKVKHFYFTLEHPERKAYRDLILFDNLDEKYIAKSLIGISGFVLRKKILQILKENKIIEDDKYIYQYNDEQIQGFLQNLYEERKKNMCKNIQVYKQHGPTCAIACSMMVMNYYGYMDNCNRLVEKKLYDRYKSRFIDGAHYSGVASFLARNGIKVELLHSEQAYFSNEKDYISDNDYKYIYQEYTDFLNNKNKNLSTKCNVDINMSFIRQKLEEGKLVMLAGNVGEDLHSILICGYKDEDFIVCDPLMKEKRIISNDELTKYMKTPIGSWCITTEKENREVDRLLEKCPVYQQEADDFLNGKYKNKSEKESYER